MIVNPFTPSEIASKPELFYGRKEELRKIERSIKQSSITIQGPIGIGKSSLLSQLILHMCGFASEHKSKCVTITAHKDIAGVDDLARIILEKFVSADEEKKTIKVSLFKVFEVESQEVYKNFSAGRHLSVLTRLLQKDLLGKEIEEGAMMIIAIDATSPRFQ